MNSDKPHKKNSETRPSDYLCCISFLNINCAYWRNSCATSIYWYFRAQTPSYLCWIKTVATIRTKWWNLFICSRKAVSLSGIWCTWTATKNIRVYFFELKSICSKYGHEWWLAPSALATKLWWNHHLIWRATSDVRIYDFDIQLNCAGNGLLIRQLKEFGARYVNNESWKLDSLHVITFKYSNCKCGSSICYKHDKLMRSNCLCAEYEFDTWPLPISVLSL